jgi:predicted lipoprotein with Yx(FWY)xxD motif
VGRRWSGLAAVATVTMVGGLVLSSTASAQVVGKSKTPKPTKVVKEVVRGTFGEILTNKKGHTLYIQPGGSCTGGCLTIWPPLFMPKGKTVPGGVSSGLGTVSTGSGLQVTYNGMPLYTFYTDTKTSTSGENVGGFVVAQVSAPAS